MKIYLHSLDIEDIIKVKATLNEHEYMFDKISDSICNFNLIIFGVKTVQSIVNDEIRITMKNGVNLDINYPEYKRMPVLLMYKNMYSIHS